MNLTPAQPRILAHAGRLPWPLRHGGRLRLHHMLRALAAQGCPVTLALPSAELSQATNDCVLPGVELIAIPLESNGAQEHSLLDASGARRFFGYEPPIGRWIRENAVDRQFDVLLLSGLARGVYAADSRIGCVWDIVDDPLLHIYRDTRWNPLLWPSALRRAAAFTIATRECARDVSSIVVSSPTDARWMRFSSGSNSVESITNGVDADWYSNSAAPGEPGTIAFVGSLSFPPNIDAIVRFTRRIWPTLHGRDPARRLLVVGKTPVDEVCALASIAGVELAADVPDVRPWLQRASVIVVPTRKGGGVKNKILEACAAGRPVVASPVAVDGLTARPGRDLLVARSPGEWIAQVESLLTKPHEAAAIGLAGREWVLRDHDWNHCGRRLLDLMTRAGSTDGSTARSIPGRYRTGNLPLAESTCP